MISLKNEGFKGQMSFEALLFGVNMSNNRRNSLECFILGVMVTILVLLMCHFVDTTFLQGRGDTSPESRTARAKVEEIDDLIEQEYLFEADEDDLSQGMYAGLVDGIGDKYSRYYTKEEYESVQQSNEGHYEGIGIVMMQDKDSGMVQVAHCYEGSPAEEAGILEGDIIYKVGDTMVADKELSEVSQVIKDSGERVIHLTVYRQSEKKYIEVALEKAEIEIPAVSYQILEDGVGYIAIYQFTAVVPEQFRKACQQLKEQGMDRLIVDLRDNPGGLLTSVCDTLNSFMPKGLMVYTEDKNGNRTEHFSEGETPLDIPLAVLVNQNSASSSEIFAGAVKDYGVGTLVGTTTYGKGIVQKTFGLNDGSVVKLTVSSYYTPNGINIHGTGIEPDVEVEQPEEATEDLQLQAALELIRKE